MRQRHQLSEESKVSFDARLHLSSELTWQRCVAIAAHDPSPTCDQYGLTYKRRLALELASETGITARFARCGLDVYGARIIRHAIKQAPMTERCVGSRLYG